MLKAFVVRLVLAALRTAGQPQSEPEDLLEATLEVSQTQLLAQLADETSLDGRTVGVLGFLGALLAADVAAKNILGEWWWTPLVVVGVATVPCMWSVFAGDTRLGPPGLTFYATYGGYPSQVAREQLLADLNAAYETNAGRVQWKQIRLRMALIVTVLGLAGSALMITLDRPTKISNHVDGTTATTSACPGTGAGAVHPASSHTKRHQVKLGRCR